MTTATPRDVRQIIETSLSDLEIDGYLQRAREDNELANDTDEMGEVQLRRIEELLTSIKILSQVDRDRSVSQQMVGSHNRAYESGKIAELRAELHKWDPSSTLSVGVLRDSDRNLNTTAEK